MRLYEEALRWIERQALEQHARIDAAKAALIELEREKQQILAMAARDGLDPIQIER